MSILDNIIDSKRREVEGLRRRWVPDELKELAVQAPPPREFRGAVKHPLRAALIAEIKHASPSRGVLVEVFDPWSIAGIYQDNGASAISVLTDQEFFQGSLAHLESVKSATTVPVLRKDFVVDEYQVYESRMHGADALLLIAKVLPAEELGRLLAVTESLGMEALVEVHDESDIGKALAAGATIIGINNRDLDTFETDVAVTEALRPLIPPGKVVVSESGIVNGDTIKRLRRSGVDAFLVGEVLMVSPDVMGMMDELVEACRNPLL